MSNPKDITYKQEQALIDFKYHLIDVLQFIEKDDKESVFRSLIRPFGFDIVKLEDKRMTEESNLAAITKAMRQLNRLGKRLSVTSICRIARMNQRNCRQLMVKYGMFDIETKKINNYFDDWQAPDF
jgi:CRISPR/Cas system-associated protein Cas5 (RAMP superfamily)